MSPNKAMIDFGHLLVRVQTPSERELVIQGEGALHRLALCSAMRARRYLQYGCSGFMAYVLDTKMEIKTMIEDVLVF